MLAQRRSLLLGDYICLLTFSFQSDQLKNIISHNGRDSPGPGPLIEVSGWGLMCVRLHTKFRHILALYLDVLN